MAAAASSVNNIQIALTVQGSDGSYLLFVKLPSGNFCFQFIDTFDKAFVIKNHV